MQNTTTFVTTVDEFIWLTGRPVPDSIRILVTETISSWMRILTGIKDSMNTEDENLRENLMIEYMTESFTVFFRSVYLLVWEEEKDVAKFGESYKNLVLYFRDELRRMFWEDLPKEKQKSLIEVALLKSSQEIPWMEQEDIILASSSQEEQELWLPWEDFPWNDAILALAEETRQDFYDNMSSILSNMNPPEWGWKNRWKKH